MPTGVTESRWWRSYAYPLRLAGMFLSVVTSILCVGAFERTASGSNVIWLANGLLLAFLLLVPRWRWPVYVCVGYLAMVLGSVLIGESFFMSLVYDTLNFIEIMVAALLLKRKSSDLPVFADGRYLLRFITFACLLGPPYPAYSLEFSTTSPTMRISSASC